MQELDSHIQSVGAAPGIEHDDIGSLPGGAGPARVTCIDYCLDQV